MSALPISENTSGKAPKIPIRRMPPHMDFTPMVDLGFLLITFFMLTTSLSKPQIMPLVMPDKESGVMQEIKQSKVLTLLLGEDNKVYWYEGLEKEHMDSTGFDREGLRQVILHKMDKVQDQFGLQTYQDVITGESRQGSQLNVIIKPGKQSNYKNLVDALDEMNICRVRYYCIMDPDPAEAKQLEK